MEKVISTERIPIKLWLDDIEDGALQQAKNAANLPFAFRHIAVMPDAHWGYGIMIGGVLATERVVIPYAVGSDVGCGVCAIQTPLHGLTKDQLKKITQNIRMAIPVGYKHHKEPQHHTFYPSIGLKELEVHGGIVNDQKDRIASQVGTLGGGNHFLEFQTGSDGFVWIMIHSGSRNLGKRVADHYNKLAQQKNKEWFSSVPADVRLAFLPIDHRIGKDYLTEMDYCVRFAFANRKLMMIRAVDAFYSAIPGIKIEMASMINIAHNYAALENHFGKNVLVHRKGATQARLGQIGIIPGSMGTNSYIVRGLGNRESFESCSHGAGRSMGRKQAKRELNVETEAALMEAKGITGHSIRSISDLEEAPSAYKDISVVMSNQEDLVEKVVELFPIRSIKG